MEQIKIGKCIAELRKEKNMTQTNLADKLGVSFKTISKWETGRGMPELSLLKPLSEELGITINELLNGDRIEQEKYMHKLEENIINTIDYSDKKSRKKQNILKLIIALILIVFVFIVGRKMIILSILQNKAKEYTESKNYYSKTISNGGEQIMITELYVKDNSYILYATNISESGVNKITDYSDGININKYLESANGDKIALLDSDGTPSVTMIPDYVYTGNNFAYFLFASMFLSIKSENINGRDCYYLDKIFSPAMIMPIGKNNGVYLDKETGLPVRGTNGTIIYDDGRISDIVVDYEYKFNVVADEDIQEPDITQYKIQENN